MNVRNAIGLVLLCTLVVNCSGSNSPEQKTELDTPGTEATAPQGWDIVHLVSYNYADTDIDAIGHFKTVPNACHQDAAGALDLTTWNRMAILLNQAMKVQALDSSSELCFPRPNNSKLFGTVEIVTNVPAGTPGSHAPALTAFSIFSRPSPRPTPSVTLHPDPRPTPTHSMGPTPTPSPSQAQVKRTILENSGDQICTTINDQSVAVGLIGVFDDIANMAFKEDCERAP